MIPSDFEVSDSVYSYCEKKGWPPAIADFFLPEMKEYFSLKESKWKDWDRVLKMWIYRESPLANKTQSLKWERALKWANEHPQVDEDLLSMVKKNAPRREQRTPSRSVEESKQEYTRPAYLNQLEERVNEHRKLWAGVDRGMLQQFQQRLREGKGDGPSPEGSPVGHSEVPDEAEGR